jgi:hypothetical protein
MKISDQEALGTLGELYYQAVFGGTLSSNKYDSEKDLTEDGGMKVEIKTQSRHPNGSFTVNKAHQTNLRKCLTVDKLIFVEYSLSDTITIWECTDRAYFSTTTSDGRNMACFPIEKMKVLKKIKQPKLAELMRNFSNSRTLKHYD